MLRQNAGGRGVMARCPCLIQTRAPASKILTPVLAPSGSLSHDIGSNTSPASENEPLRCSRRQAKNRFRYRRGAAKKGAGNPMKAGYPFQSAPRCTATSKRTRQRCGAPAERGKSVCRFHGARAGAPQGSSNGAYKHGRFTNEAIEERRQLSELVKASRGMVSALQSGGLG